MEQSKQLSGVTVKYTADKMKAFVALSGNSGQITLGMILRELIHKKIVHGLDTETLDKFVASPQFDTYIEVARGTSPTPGRDGEIEVLVKGAVGANNKDNVGGADDKPFLELIAVKAGTPVVRRIPQTKGEDGMDVFGDVIPAPSVKDIALRSGSGVMISRDNPNVLIAERDGVLERTSNGVFKISPFKEISGDMAPATGAILFAGHLKIGGSILSGVSINVDGSLVIMGETKNAIIKCGGDLALYAPVRGGDNATIHCGGSVRAVSLENVKLIADSDVTVSKNIANSNIFCKGALKAANILGGSISAVCGIRAVRIGDESGLQTVLDVGGVHNYVKELDNLKGGIDTQDLLSEGCISELYCFVRDNMNEFGSISEEKSADLESYKKKLIDTIAVRRSYEESIDKLETLLKDAAACSITALEIYPNVLLRLGFSEQNVTEVIKNVNLKPMGISDGKTE